MLDLDFSRPVTLAHVARGTGVFDGTTERGRATATVGAGNAGLVFRAARLGTRVNGMVVTVAAAGRRAVRIDPGSTRRLVYTPATGDAANDAATGFDAALRLGRATREAAAAYSDYEIFTAVTGSGVDPVASGSATFAGGEDPDMRTGFPAYMASNVNAGRFDFDTGEPLRFKQLLAHLEASVAWSLTLYVRDTRGATMASVPIASGTGQQIFHSSDVIIPPRAAIGFTASAQGFVAVTVERARA